MFDMKAKLFPFYLLLIFSVTSCTIEFNQNQSNRTPQKKYILKTYLNNFLSRNKGCFKNEITRSDCSMKLQESFLRTQLGDSIKCISEIPIEFKMLMKYGTDKYVVKFVYSDDLNTTKISDKFTLGFQVFSIVDKNIAVKLEENKKYHIFGSCHDYVNKKSFTLPNGDYIESYPSIHKLYGDEIFIYLGTLVVKNLSFIPAE